jgi:hypothetical protein
MKRLMFPLFVLVATLSVAGIALAQSTPAEDPKDNVCYAGGVWESRCDWPTDAEDEWAWNCGWYYARVLDGRIGAEEAPSTCKLLIDAGGDDHGGGGDDGGGDDGGGDDGGGDDGGLDPLCYPNTVIPNISVFYTGPANQLGNLARHKTDDCSDTPTVSLREGVFEAADSAAALALCEPLTPPGSNPTVSGRLAFYGYTSAPTNLWVCFYDNL